MDIIVSIVTPSFNQAEFLNATLESIISQEGDFYIDMILVDGASTDKSVDIIKQTSDSIINSEVTLQKDGLNYHKNMNVKCKGISFRWKSEKDSGQADAINKGFAQASGDIICWLNSDDTYASSRTLKYVTDFFNANPSENFVYGKGYTLNREGEITGEENYIVDSASENINEIDYILQPASFWRRKIYEEFGELNPKYHFVLDWDYWVRINKKYNLNFVNEFLACNRIYAETKTSSGAYRRYIEILKFLDENNSLTEKSISSYVVYPEIQKDIGKLDIFTRSLYILSHKIQKDGVSGALAKIYEKTYNLLRRRRLN